MMCSPTCSPALTVMALPDLTLKKLSMFEMLTVKLALGNLQVEADVQYFCFEIRAMKNGVLGMLLLLFRGKNETPDNNNIRGW